MVTLIVLSTLLSLIKTSTASHWLSASDGKCQFTLSNELIISFSEYPSLFINKFKKKNLVECHAACCLHETCNGYVWDALDTDNCKLLKCSSGGEDCKRALTSSNGVTIGEVGFITGLSESQESATTTTTTTIKPTTTVNVTVHHSAVLKSGKTKPNIVSNSLAWLSQRMKVPHNVTTNSTLKVSKTVQRKASHPLTNSSSHGLGLTANKRISSKDEIDKMLKVLTPTRKTAVTVLPKRSSNHDHSDTSSLTIALLFGVFFVVVVFVLLGRRWIEGIRDQRKRGYTRISYLLNGV